MNGFPTLVISRRRPQLHPQAHGRAQPPKSGEAFNFEYYSSGKMESRRNRVVSKHRRHHLMIFDMIIE